MNLDNKKKIIISAVLLLILVVAFAIYMIIENESPETPIQRKL